MQHNGKSVVVDDTKNKNCKGNRKNYFVPYEELSGTQKVLRCIITLVVCFVEKSLHYAFSYWLPPVYYVFFMYFIRSRVVADSGMTRELIEIPITLFGLINISGNFLMHRFTDVSLKAYAHREFFGKRLEVAGKSCGDASNLKVNYCDKCNLYQVEGSWHCKICDQCVVGRDYHCFMFSQCVTRQNKRYYILGLFYTSCGLIYIYVYALMYTCPDDDMKSIYCIPHLGYFLFYFLMGLRYRFALDAYGCWLTNLIILFNTPMFVLTLGMFITNLKHVIRRTTYWESKKREKGHGRIWNHHVFEVKRFWLPLAEEVLGERWYLAILSPFVSSPLPKKA